MEGWLNTLRPTYPPFKVMNRLPSAAVTASNDKSKIFGNKNWDNQDITPSIFQFSRSDMRYRNRFKYSKTTLQTTPTYTKVVTTQRTNRSITPYDILLGEEIATHFTDISISLGKIKL